MGCHGYYDGKLSAERLRKCYEIAPPRVKRYLDAEVEHVLSRVRKGDSVLELGCGYGRVLEPLVGRAGSVFGIDTSLSSLLLARETLRDASVLLLANMDAVRLGFHDNLFDVVVCVQNGISAFHVNQKILVSEAVRVCVPGGTVLFSTYAERFWEERLEWFRVQTGAGLLGAIDEEKTHDGVIVCEDGFTATTVSPERFRSLTVELDAAVSLIEVDGSSLFCEIIKKGRR
jgi:SAM-dependent methyltransferase